MLAGVIVAFWGNQHCSLVIVGNFSTINYRKALEIYIYICLLYTSDAADE